MAERSNSSIRAERTWAGEDAVQVIAFALSQLEQHLHQEVLKVATPAYGDMSLASAAAVFPAVIKTNPLLRALQKCSRQLAKLKDSLIAQAHEVHWTEGRRLALGEEGRKAQSALLQAQQLANNMYHGSLAQLDGAFGADTAHHRQVSDTIESCDSATAVTAAALSSVISALSNFPSRPSAPLIRKSSSDSSSGTSSSGGGGGFSDSNSRDARHTESRPKRRPFSPRLPGKGEPFEPPPPASKGTTAAAAAVAPTAAKGGTSRGIFRSSSGGGGGGGGSGGSRSGECNLGRGICRSASSRSCCRSQAAADSSGSVWAPPPSRGKTETRGRVRGGAAAWGERSTTSTATETAVALGLAPVTRARVNAAEEARNRAFKSRREALSGSGGSGLAETGLDADEGMWYCPERERGCESEGARREASLQSAAGGGKVSTERLERPASGGGGLSARPRGGGLETSLWAERRGQAAAPTARVGFRPSRRRSSSPAPISPDQSTQGAAPFSSAVSFATSGLEGGRRIAAGGVQSRTSAGAATADKDDTYTFGSSHRSQNATDDRNDPATGGSQENERLSHAFLGNNDPFALLAGSGGGGGNGTTTMPATATTRARSPTGPFPRRTLGTTAAAARAASVSRRQGLLDLASEAGRGGEGGAGRRGLRTRGAGGGVATRRSTTAAASHAAAPSRATTAAASAGRRSQSALVSSPRQLQSVGCFVAARAVGAAAAAALAAAESDGDEDGNGVGGASGHPQGIDDDEAAARRLAKQEQEAQAREDELLAMRLAAREEAHAERRRASSRRRRTSTSSSSSSSSTNAHGRRRLHVDLDDPAMTAANIVLAAAMAGGSGGGADGNVSEAVRALQFQDIDENDFETLLALDEAGGEGGRSCAGGKGMTEEAVEGVLQSVAAAGERLEESCAICMVDFELDDEIAVLPCHHAFHGECIRKWLLLRNRCPTDMQPVIPDSPAEK